MGVTTGIQAWKQGDQRALDRLMATIYPELAKIAHACLARESHCTLDTSDLVHETYLKLRNSRCVQWNNAPQLYGMSSRMMKHALVDHARRKKAKKRGQDPVFVPMREEDVPFLPKNDVSDLRRGLERYAEIQPLGAALIVMRYLLGLSINELVAIKGLSASTVHRELRAAKAWLYLYVKGKLN